MSDFSLFSLFTAGLACMIPLSAAYTQPTGNAPQGNPISEPGLNSVVPAGKTYTITWEPTTKGTVTLVLLKGPSSNAVPLYPIVEMTPNDGSYVWTVSNDLAPTENAMGYGIQLIDDATGQYQYTTQFGVSNDHYTPGSSSNSTASSTSSAWAQTTSGAQYTTKFVTDYTTYCPYATTFAAGNKTYTVTAATTLTIKDCSCTISHPVSSATASAKPVPLGTGSPSVAPMQNVTMVAPTGSGPTGSAPTTLTTSSAPTYNMPSATPAATTSSVSPAKGAASTLVASFASLALAGAVAAVLAF